jgi:hypothetical protein
VRKNWEVRGEASNASDAIAAIKPVHPQVVVPDVSMPGISGLGAARLIGKLDLSTRALIFTMHQSARLASGYARRAPTATFRNLRPPATWCTPFRLFFLAALFLPALLSHLPVLAKIPAWMGGLRASWRGAGPDLLNDLPTSACLTSEDDDVAVFAGDSSASRDGG